MQLLHVLMSAPTEGIRTHSDGRGEEEVPDAEVVPRPKRRQFTAEYKL